MSAVILPVLALGGVFLIFKCLTKKKHKRHSDSSSSSGKTKKHRSSSSSSDSSSDDSSSSSNSSSDSSSDDSSSSSNSSSNSSSSSKTKSSYGRHVKNKTRKNTNKTELLVFYTIGRVKGKRWSYNSMPSGWKVNKKGDANKYTSKYTQMVQFSGSNKNKGEMKRYIIKVFEYLKKKDIVKRFKITGQNII